MSRYTRINNDLRKIKKYSMDIQQFKVDNVIRIAKNKTMEYSLEKVSSKLYDDIGLISEFGYSNFKVAKCDVSKNSISYEDDEGNKVIYYMYNNNDLPEMFIIDFPTYKSYQNARFYISGNMANDVEGLLYNLIDDYKNEVYCSLKFNGMDYSLYTREFMRPGSNYGEFKKKFNHSINNNIKKIKWPAVLQTTLW